MSTDEYGQVVQRSLFYPFGEVRYSPDYLEAYSFTGQERDVTLGLSYHSARYLDTKTGRWISADPLFGTFDAERPELLPQMLGRYTYSSNNPVNIIDPSGLSDTIALFGPGDRRRTHYAYDYNGILIGRWFEQNDINDPVDSNPAIKEKLYRIQQNNRTNEAGGLIIQDSRGNVSVLELPNVSDQPSLMYKFQDGTIDLVRDAGFTVLGDFHTHPSYGISEYGEEILKKRYSNYPSFKEYQPQISDTGNPVKGEASYVITHNNLWRINRMPNNGNYLRSGQYVDLLEVRKR